MAGPRPRRRARSTQDGDRADRRDRRHRGARRACRGRRHRLGRSVSGPYAAGRQPRLGRPPSSRATRRRLVGLCAAFFVMFAAVVIRLADVQVDQPRPVREPGRPPAVRVEAAAGRARIGARPQRRRARAVPARRSPSSPIPQLVTRTGHVHETAAALAPLLKMDVADLRRASRATAATCCSPTPSPARWPTKIAELDLTGIGTFDEFKRYQPSGDVARSVLGRVSDDGTQGLVRAGAAVRRAAGGPARQDHLRAPGHRGRG